MVTSCVVEEVEPLSIEVVIDESVNDSQASSRDWKAFRVLDAEYLISFDFASRNQSSRTSGISTFAGLVDTQSGLMTTGSFGEIYSFPIHSSVQGGNSLWNLVLTIDREGNRNWHVREYRSNDVYQWNWNLENFSGQVIIYNLSGNILFEFENRTIGYNNGQHSSSVSRIDSYIDGDCSFDVYPLKVCKQKGGTFRRVDDSNFICTIEFFFLSNGCGTDGGSPNQGFPDGGFAGSGGGYNPPNQGVPITQPNPMSSFFNSLGSQAQGWLQSNPQVYGMVADFVLRNGVHSLKSSDLQFFIEEISELGSLDQAGVNAFGFALLNADMNFQDFTASTYQAANDYFPWDLSNPFTAFQLSQSLAVRSYILKQQNPGWSQFRVIWEASRETIQFGLDIAGLVPLLGEVADITNGVIYTLYGDGVNAGLSFANAVPVVGWATAGVKLAVMRVPKALGGTTTLKWIKNADGSLSFGDGRQLRDVLGITDSAIQAHHLIPVGLAGNEVVQLAAKSANAFHLNKALNGIPVEAWRNQPNHPAYNNLIETKLNDFLRRNPSAGPDESLNYLSDLIQDIRSWVIANPNAHLNDIILP